MGRRPIPFVLVAPAAVIALGAAAALAMAILGSLELGRHTRDSARYHRSVLVHGLAARLSQTNPTDYEALLKQAAGVSATTLLVVDGESNVTDAAPTQPFSDEHIRYMSTRTEGQLGQAPDTQLFATRRIEGTRTLLIGAAPLPDSSAQRNALITSMITFAALVLAAGGFVAWAMARDVHADVVFLRGLISSMAKEQGPPSTSPIPVRTLDQVGQLTASFNTLLERFRAAERAYRQDLTEANAFDKDRAVFLSALSHELRTPLNAILGFADVLLSEIDGPLSEEARENLTIVRTSGEHLRALIDDILALGAMESGQFRLSREDLDIASVANDVVTEARVTAQQKGIQLELDHPSDAEESTAYADRRRIRQILGNVINNAVKFTHEGGVNVKVDGDEEAITVVVSDTGPGIAPDAVERIFKEFQQAGAGAQQGTGTGLGLAITRRLVHLHGGTIKVASTLGQGATFTIRLPRREPPTNLSPLVPPVTEPVIFDS